MKTLIAVIALFALAAHVWFSRSLHVEPNQVILTEAVKPVVEEAFEGISIHYDHLDGILEGIVNSENEKQQIEQKARENIRAGRIVNRLTIQEATLPASLAAKWNGKEFELLGSVATETQRKEIGLAFYALKMGPVNNRITTSSKVIKPAWLPKLMAFPLEFFTQNPSQPAQVEVLGNQIRLTSVFRDETLKRNVLQDAGILGLAVMDEISILPKKPCHLSASLSKQVLQLQGLVPSKEFSTALEKAAAQTGAKVTNQLSVESHSEPPKWGEHAAEFLSAFFADTPAGELEFQGNQIRLKRPVNHVEEKEEWLTHAKKVLAGAKIVDEMKFPAEQRLFDLALKRKANLISLEGWLPSLDLKNKILSQLKLKFPTATIENKIFAAPNVRMPDWGMALPDFMAGLPGSGDFDLVRFSGEGVALPQEKREDWAKIAFTSIGKKFPSFQVPEFGEKSPGLELGNPAVPAVGVVDVPPATIAPVVGPPPTPEPKKQPPAPKPVMVAKVDTRPVVVPPPSPEPKKPVPVSPPASPITLPPPRRIPELPRTQVYAANTYPASLHANLKDNQIKLIGNVPTEKTKKTLGDAVSSVLPGVGLSNLLNVDKRVIPPFWENELPAFLKDFFKTKPKEAELEIDHDRLRLEQSLPNAGAKAEFVTRARALLPQGRFIDQLSTPGYDPTRVYELPPPTRNQEPRTKNQGQFVVYFATASSSIDKAGLREIDEASDFYRKSRGSSAVVLGFTDGRGNVAFNKRLSEKRAQAVVEKLVDKGVSSAAIKYEGVGPQENSVGDVREHRRVEVTIE